VVEVGAGLGSLTRALAALGATVLALELDRALLPALEEATAGFERVRVERIDAVQADWPRLLAGADRWVMVANLPYNVAVPVVMGALHRAPTIEHMLVMVQREVGERLAAGPGEEQYGAVSVRVASVAEARVVRRVAASVFWPRPRVESVLVRIDRRPSPVAGPDSALFRVVEAAFAERRKTMRNALMRLGLGGAEALDTLRGCGIDPSARPEELGLEAFACLADRLPE
jgi:16S rRNA (adenine1518-N6/adenine1519-N6)-dimethyltransferase